MINYLGNVSGYSIIGFIGWLLHIWQHAFCWEQELTDCQETMDVHMRMMECCQPVSPEERDYLYIGVCSNSSYFWRYAKRDSYLSYPDSSCYDDRFLDDCAKVSWGELRKGLIL